MCFEACMEEAKMVMIRGRYLAWGKDWIRDKEPQRIKGVDWLKGGPSTSLRKIK